MRKQWTPEENFMRNFMLKFQWTLELFLHFWIVGIFNYIFMIPYFAVRVGEYVNGLFKCSSFKKKTVTKMRYPSVEWITFQCGKTENARRIAQYIVVLFTSSQNWGIILKRMLMRVKCWTKKKNEDHDEVTKKKINK